MTGITRSWWVATRIVSTSFRATLQYRIEFLLAILNGVIWQASVLAFAAVLVTRFSGMGGWQPGAVLLIASMRMLSHAGYVAGYSNLANTFWLAREGQLESYLLRPIPVYRQVLLSTFRINAVGDLTVAATLFVVALGRLPVAWTGLRAAYFLCAVAGGTLLEAAVQTAVGAIAIRLSGASVWSLWIDDLMALFGNYPLSILPTVVRVVFTVVVPLAFEAYLPAAVLLGRAGATGVPYPIALCSPLLGLVLFVAAKRLWTWSLRHYQGIGG
jgi:viologen exporter family transport system permease protein